jgi:hypothetical protein
MGKVIEDQRVSCICKIHYFGVYTGFCMVHGSKPYGLIIHPDCHSLVYAPNVPAAYIVGLAERLQHIENALSGLSVDSERTKAKVDNGVRGYHDLVSQLGALETRLSGESRKVMEAGRRVRDAAGRG